MKEKGMNLTISKIQNKNKDKYKQQDELDKLANLYNKTKDKQYRDKWFKLVQEIVKQI